MKTFRIINSLRIFVELDVAKFRARRVGPFVIHDHIVGGPDMLFEANPYVPDRGMSEAGVKAITHETSGYAFATHVLDTRADKLVANTLAIIPEFAWASMTDGATFKRRFGSESLRRVGRLVSNEKAIVEHVLDSSDDVEEPEGTA